MQSRDQDNNRRKMEEKEQGRNRPRLVWSAAISTYRMIALGKDTSRVFRGSRVRWQFRRHTCSHVLALNPP
jgi:hypothetical protein